MIEKYAISINLDSKIIGFYKPEIQNYKEINRNETILKNYNLIKITKYIFSIIIIIVIVFISYYLGVRARERKRKLANELSDDNYEYITEKNKNINENNSNLDKQKFIELNSKLGL